MDRRLPIGELQRLPRLALHKAAPQQVARDPLPVACARAPIADGIKLGLQDIACFGNHLLFPGFPREETLASARPHGRPGHASEANPRAGDFPRLFVKGEMKGAANTRYVLIKALADLVHSEEAARSRGWNQDRFHEFGTPPVLAPIFDNIAPQRDLAVLGPAVQAQPGIERDQGGWHVADRRAVGDIAADRAEIPDLDRAETVDQRSQLWMKLDQVNTRVRVGHGCPETKTLP